MGVVIGMICTSFIGHIGKVPLAALATPESPVNLLPFLSLGTGPEYKILCIEPFSLQAVSFTVADVTRVLGPTRYDPTGSEPVQTNRSSCSIAPLES